LNAIFVEKRKPDSASHKTVVFELPARRSLAIISDTFEMLYKKLSQDEPAEPEDRDEYLTENESTAFLSNEKMREFIHRIVETMRNNTTVDWEKCEDVRAKLRVMVKRLLMRYRYQPNWARMEADRVLA